MRICYCHISCVFLLALSRFQSFFFLVEADIGRPLIEVLRDFFHPYLAVEGLDFRFLEEGFLFFQSWF